MAVHEDPGISLSISSYHSYEYNIISIHFIGYIGWAIVANIGT